MSNITINQFFKVSYFLRLLLLALLLLSVQQLQSQGIKFDKERYEQDEFDDNSGYKRKKPRKYSLLKYMHTPFNQGSFGICTACAVAATRSIVYAKENNITDSKTKDSLSLSPGFIYCQIKGKDDSNCKDGSYIDQALELLNKTGVCLNKSLSQHCIDAIPTETLKTAHKYRTKGFRRLEHFSKKNGKLKKVTLDEMKYILVETPLVAAIKTPQSFHNLKSKDWIPKENFSTFRASHAVVIIGYDEKYRIGKKTGAFQILNSWGNGWGDNGTCWISEADLRKWCSGAYYMINDIKDMQVASIFKKIKERTASSNNLNVRGTLHWNMQMWDDASEVMSPLLSKNKCRFSISENSNETFSIHAHKFSRMLANIDLKLNEDLVKLDRLNIIGRGFGMTQELRDYFPIKTTKIEEIVGLSGFSTFIKPLLVGFPNPVGTSNFELTTDDVFYKLSGNFGDASISYFVNKNSLSITKIDISYLDVQTEIIYKWREATRIHSLPSSISIQIRDKELGQANIKLSNLGYKDVTPDSLVSN